MTDYLYNIEKLHQVLTLKKNQLQSDAARLAQTALLKEVYLTPKPGLVDQNNSGSHRDMDLLTFLQSIAAITPYLDQFYYYGMEFNNNDISFLTGLRMVGRECELAMFAATNNINTHKGAIFAFALILSSIGYLQAQGKVLNYLTICEEVAFICQGIIERELVNSQGTTMGERLFLQYGFTGARGEAQSGYSLVKDIALPVYRNCHNNSFTEQQTLLHTMLHLIANNNDTNILSRGGIEGLNFVKTYASELLTKNCGLTPSTIIELQQFDQQLIEKNLSPGGSADLISITWFLSHYDE